MVQGTARLTVAKGSSQLGRVRRRKAMERGQFVPYYQPLVELSTGRIKSYEVLARWNHPDLGLLLPDKFTAQAESEGWVGDLTQHLIQSVLHCAQSLDPAMELAINLSPCQAKDLTLPGHLKDVATQWGFSLQRLTLEITETPFTEDRDRALLVARELKQMGCKLALNNFGTGRSSLHSLLLLPFNEIKMDRCFIDSMIEQRESRKIVASVINLGQSLGITTVAEGVKTQEQADMLLRLGCDLGQGWFYGRPVPEEQLRLKPSNPAPFRALIPMALSR